MFNGSSVAVVTPMANGTLDLKALSHLVEWHIEKRTQAMIVTGTTGESATLSMKEKCVIYEHAVAVSNHRMPIYAGTGSNNTMEAVTLSKKAQEIGVDGLLVVTPYYNKPNQRGLYAHFETIAQSVDLPIILYNVPSRTSVDLLPETVKALADLKNIKGIKEASGNIERIKTLKAILPEQFKIYSGNDHDVVEVIKAGGHGVVSVLANVVPDVVQNMCQEALSGNYEIANKLQKAHLTLIDALFSDTNPIPVKEVLALMGHIRPDMRLPLLQMTSEARKDLSHTLIEYQLIEEVIYCK